MFDGFCTYVLMVVYLCFDVVCIDNGFGFVRLL